MQGMAQSSPTAAAGSSPPSIEADSATGARSAVVHHPFTVGDTPGRPFIRPHRLAQVIRDQDMLDAIEPRLREGSPKSGAKHICLDEAMLADVLPVAPAESNWTPWVLAAALCAMPFIAALVSGGF